MHSACFLKDNKKLKMAYCARPIININLHVLYKYVCWLLWHFCTKALKNHRLLVFCWFLCLWRTTASVVKKFPANRTRKQKPHMDTCKKKRSRGHRNFKITVIIFSWVDLTYYFIMILWKGLQNNTDLPFFTFRHLSHSEERNTVPKLPELGHIDRDIQ